MEKKQTFGLVIVIFLIGGYMLYDQLQKTTYQEVLSSVIGKDESIIEVSVVIDEPLLSKSESVTIQDPKVIKQLMDLDFKVKKSRNHEDLKNSINIRTNKGLHQIYFSYNYVVVGGETYYKIDPVIIPLYDYIEEHDFDWEVATE
ncbi:hypothetical protein ACFFF5_08830 [Lederbergia wuyishanensis]|uniref:Uncharacterized protein n=1 Tax=Lederbergia wuyishanensis TaxID=1347903 RepID=A0ABU0D655_9BACI|nr:hypothetical protein [Lederbergia wuyishanensis]MCJ8008707.1 hypothetical protein [Lederbergia wuyishanensis]MDQ0343874.1 hypothetical protein [Lederbergia wuyishanensis]